MAKQTAAQQSNLGDLNIVPFCKVKVLNTTTWKTETVAEVVYSPAAINKALKKNKLQSAWVFCVWGKEFWMVGKGRLAKQDKGGK